MDIFVGIDLAGTSNNPTGFCILRGKHTKTKLLYTNSEIINEIATITTLKPLIIAIDSPLSFNSDRKCDRELKKYGAMPLSLKSIRILADRGVKLAKKLQKMNYQVIEVFPTATAKILGVFNNNREDTRQALIKSGLKGSITTKITKHEVDAVLAAITAHLYKNGLTVNIGDERGLVVIPKTELQSKDI